MKKALLILALLVALGSTALWVRAGANRGWTKTSVRVTTIDEVTGLSGVSYEKRFVPGLDFLGASLVGAALVAGASFLFRGKSSQQVTSEKST